MIHVHDGGAIALKCILNSLNSLSIDYQSIYALMLVQIASHFIVSIRYMQPTTNSQQHPAVKIYLHIHAQQIGVIDPTLRVDWIIITSAVHASHA